MNNYEVLASFYDKFNEDLDYTSWAKYVDELLRSAGIPNDAIILDAACGTGKMTIELAKLGYDMIGTDLSPEMLMQARDRAYEAGVEPLFLMQDLTKLDLYGTVRAITCCLDSLNYLQNEKKLEKFFSLAHNYIEKDGLLIFDMNSKYKFENVYGDNCYVFEDEKKGVFLSWQNFYDKETQNCHFVLDFFIKDENKSYKRFCEDQVEHMFEHESVLSLLERTGFEVISVCADINGTPYTKTSERIHYVAKRI